MITSCTNQIQEPHKWTKEKLMDFLREKIICETQGLLRSLYRGYRPDVQFILSEIQLIDMLSQDQIDETFSLYALQYYLNNLWQQS